MLGLGLLYFYCLLFILIHTSASLLMIIATYLTSGQVRPWVALLGMSHGDGHRHHGGGQLVTRAVVALYPLKWLGVLSTGASGASGASFDRWATPLMMGLVAWVTQMVLRLTVNDAGLQAD